jgi:hypothetical protein
MLVRCSDDDAGLPRTDCDGRVRTQAVYWVAVHRSLATLLFSLEIWKLGSVGRLARASTKGLASITIRLLGEMVVFGAVVRYLGPVGRGLCG